MNGGLARRTAPIRLLALGLGGAAVILAIVVLLTRSGPPAAAGVVVDAAERDGFRLELVVDASRFAPNEPISADASLTEMGSKSVTVSGTAVVWFSLVERDGTRSVQNAGASRLVCAKYTLQPGVPVTFPFAKTGSWSPGDPNADFFSSFFADPQLRLPAGRWEIEAFTSFAIGPSYTRTGTIDLATRVAIVVEGPSSAVSAVALTMGDR